MELWKCNHSYESVTELWKCNHSYGSVTIAMEV